NTTKLEDEDHLEKAMLKETDSSALRAESQKKEKEYSNGLKNNNDTSGKEEISEKAPQSTETATSAEVTMEEEVAPVEGAKETSDKVSPENTIPSPVQPTTSQEYPGEEEEEEEAAAAGKKDAHSEFEDSVAEDSEDETTHERHGIEKKDYHSMTKEELVTEFEHLLNKEKIQAIKEHVEEIKIEYNAK